MSRHNYWTKEEIEFTRNNYFLKSAEEIANILGRTELSVKTKIQRLHLLKKKMELPMKYKLLDEGLAYILGVILGDGCINIIENNKNSFGNLRLSSIDLDFALEFKRVIERWSDKKANLYNYNVNNKDFFTVVFNSKQSAKFVKSFIDNRLNEILRSSKKIQRAFLRGLFDSEGAAYGYNLDKLRESTRQIQFYNSEEKIIIMVRGILSNLGINCSISSRVHSGFGSNKIQYTLTICRRENFIKFKEYIGFSIQRKNDALDKIINSYVIK